MQTVGCAGPASLWSGSPRFTLPSAPTGPTCTVTPSLTLSCLRQGAQGRRRGVRGLGVVLLAQAGNTYCANDFAVYAYRHAAAQCRDAGGDECRSAPIDVVLYLRRPPL